MSNFISTTFLNQQALIDSLQSDRRQAAPALPLAAPQAERSAAELAAAVPAAQRDQLRAIYVQLMPKYKQIEQKLGWPNDDVAGAVAALIAGNYMVMTNTTLSDPVVTAAGNQLRGSPAVQQMLRKLGADDRRRLYEQCAMLGTFMALAQMTRARQPDEVQANLRGAARENLKVFLGDAVGRLRFTAAGIALD